MLSLEDGLHHVGGGLYVFQEKPLRLFIAPATYQQVMDTFLAIFRWYTCLLYLYDVAVFSGTFQGHLQRLTYGAGGYQRIGPLPKSRNVLLRMPAAQAPRACSKRRWSLSKPRKDFSGCKLSNAEEQDGSFKFSGAMLPLRTHCL